MQLLDAAQNLIVPFVANADASTTAKQHGKSPQYDGVRGRRTALVETLSPEELSPLLIEGFVKDGKGKEGLVEIGKKVLDYSVNTWDQGFLDKLYGNTDAVGGSTFNSTFQYDEAEGMNMLCCCRCREYIERTRRD